MSGIPNMPEFGTNAASRTKMIKEKLIEEYF